METAVIIFSIISALLLVFTLICGLWIKYSGEADASSVNFHMGLALTTIAVVLITLGMTVSEMA